MDQSGSQMDNTILIPPAALLPIVKKHFEKISAAQWSMLAAGTWESDTEATLADMFTEIVQTLSAAVLRFVIPMFQECMFRSASQADINTTLENFTAQLGDSLPGSFAVALHVPQDKCENTKKLTRLVQMEVSQKVKSVISVIISNTVWPSKPAIFVTGSMSNIASLRDIVFHATKCLKRYLGKLNSQCLGLCWQPKSIEFAPLKSSESPVSTLDIRPERCASSQSIKSEISVPSATKAVTEILVKRSSETTHTAEEAENCDLPLSTALDAHYAASEIVKDIIEDLHFLDSRDEASCSSRPHLNMGLILHKVRDFFDSQATPSEDTTNANQGVRKRSFSKFAQKQFEKMMAELKSTFKAKDINFLVRFKQDPGSSQRRPTIEDYSDEAIDNILPGAVPDSPKPKPEASAPTSKTTIISVRKQLSSPLNFENIKDDVDCLFNKLNLKEKPAAQSNKALEVIMSSGEIRKFSKELTDKMYGHLVASQTYQIPMVPIGRSLSDSVISELGRTVDATKSHFSPEVLYVITEDAVGKFLQQVLLWMETEPSNKTAHSEEVSSALTDIEDLITTMLTPPAENDDIQPDSSEASNRKTTTPSHSDRVSSANDAARSTSLNIEVDCDACKHLNFKLHVDSQHLIECNVKVTSDVKSPEVTSKPTPISYPCLPVPHHSQVSCSEKSGGSNLAVSIDTTSPTTERMTNNLITALLIRLITKAPRKTRRSMQTADINAIIKRLSDKVQDEINITGSAVRKTKNSMKKINIAVIKDLDKEFGCPKKILEAAMAPNNTSFDDAVVKYLQIHLNALLSSPPKKSAVARFFSAVGKALTKPFKLCITDSYED